MYPLKLVPALKDYLWGGTKLKEEYGCKTVMDKVAESWVLSCHLDGQSVVQNGSLAGKTLGEAICEFGPVCLGTHCAGMNRFPVLVKLIDARDSLSVQVHPDDEYALQVEHEPGKTEMWVIADCDDGASLIYGFKKPVSKDEFLQRVRDNTLLEVLNSVPVRKGDVFFIEAGTVHAIGKGIVIAEIQQNSNTTYRVYDYGRLDAHGNARALHVEKAADVLIWEPVVLQGAAGQPEQKDGYVSTLLASCRYFTVHKLEIETAAALIVSDDSFVSLLVLEGSCRFRAQEEIEFSKGGSLFLPAGMGDFTLEGKAVVLLTSV